MSKNMTFVLNPAGVRELLRSQEMADVIEGYASEVNDRAGAGYGHDVQTGRNRMVGRVYAETDEAYRENLDNNVLLRSLST